MTSWEIHAFSASIQIQQMSETPHHSLGFEFSNPAMDSEKRQLQCKGWTFYYNKSEIFQMLHKPYEPIFLEICILLYYLLLYPSMIK